MNIIKIIKEYYKNNRRKFLYNINFNKKKYSNLYTFIKNYYKDSESLQETIYRIYYNIDNKPKCYCGNNLSFNIFKYEYKKYCCIKCQRNDPINIQQYKNTCIKKYGVDNPGKSKISIEHGKNTCKLKYNGNSPMNSIDIINKLNDIKRKNKTFNTSIPENKSYKLLKEKYPDIKYQYRSELYPFNCDFYIPSLDLYIECNYHWTHGFKPFENTEEDNKQLEKWKNKNTKFYNNAIECWTKRDVNKRNIAKQNNLNYIEFWNINELINYINKET